MSDTNERSVASGGSLAWIPVAERLPEARLRVLGWCGRRAETVVYDEGIWCYDGEYMAIRITHWMLLPEPPTDTK